MDTYDEFRDDYPTDVPVPEAKANSGSILSEVCFSRVPDPSDHKS
jgi:hypothetical protein